MNPLDIPGLGLGWLWRASWQASVLALLVLLVQWGFRARLTPPWRHALWWLVLVRLVLPVAPESPWSIFNLARMERVRSQGDPIAVPQPFPPPPVNRAFNEPRALTDLNSTMLVAVKADPRHPPALSSAIQAPSSSTAPHPSLNPSGDQWIRRCIAWVWLLGVAFYGGRLVLGSYWLARQLRHRAPVANPAVLAVLAEGLRVLGMRRSLTLIATPAVESPALFGWVRAKLLVPNRMLETFSTEEWRYVLMHELAHLRRRDVMVNGLMVILQALHWFNPLIWFAFSRMRADRELACDALVLSFTREDEVKSYGQTIIKLLEGFPAPVRVPGLVGVLEDKRQIKRRITMIAQFKKTKRWPILAVLLMGLLCAIAMTDAQTQPKPASETAPNQTQAMKTAEPPQLYTRQFLVERDAFLEALDKIVAPSDANETNLAPNLASITLTEKIRNFLRAIGVAVELPPKLSTNQPAIGYPTEPRAFVFNDGAGILLVRATLPELDLIGRVIQTLNVPPPQITIEARLIEINQDDLKASSLGSPMAAGVSTYSAANLTSAANPLGIFPGGGGRGSVSAYGAANSTSVANPLGIFPGGGGGSVALSTNRPSAPNAELTGILTEPQFRALEKLGSVQTLLAPRVTTVSGKPILIDQRGSGFSLEVLPRVSADMISVSMKIDFSLLANFPGASVTSAVSPTAKIPRVQVSTSAVVHEGQTLILGGFPKEEPVSASGQNQLDRKVQVLCITPTIIDAWGNRVHLLE